MDTPLLAQLHETLYTHLDKRAEAIVGLIYALASHDHARSVVELSLNSLFRHGHASLYRAIDAFASQSVDLRRLAAVVAPRPSQRAFWLMSTDVTAHPRPYARTLADRSYVYAPTPTPGQKPVKVGHAYTSTLLLPEREKGAPPWVIPLDVRRVPSDGDAELMGAQALQTLLEDETMPWHGDLVVSVQDSKYSKPAYLVALAPYENLVTVVRVRNNRVFYRQYEPPPDAPKRRGRPRRYGDRFALHEPETWHAPDAECTLEGVTTRGKSHTLEVRVWRNMLMRGGRDEAMYRYPFTLIRVVMRDASGRPLHKRPLWLILFGARRDEVVPADAVRAYLQRFDHEHFFRFGKRHLLLTAFQTPDVRRGEAWHRLVFLAYLFLWAARPTAQQRWRPWEKHLQAKGGRILSPTQVQRDFARIIRALKLQPAKPKPRGKPPGRPTGYRPKPRERHSVVKKSSNRPTKRKKAA